MSRVHNMFRFLSKATISIFAVILIVGCANQGYSVNNPDSSGETGKQVNENLQDVNELLPDEEDPDFHAREMNPWSGHRDYYKTRRPSRSPGNDYVYGDPLQGNPGLDHYGKEKAYSRY